MWRIHRFTINICISNVKEKILILIRSYPVEILCFWLGTNNPIFYCNYQTSSLLYWKLTTSSALYWPRTNICEFHTNIEIWFCRIHFRLTEDKRNFSYRHSKFANIHQNIPSPISIARIKQLGVYKMSRKMSVLIVSTRIKKMCVSLKYHNCPYHSVVCLPACCQKSSLVE